MCPSNQQVYAVTRFP